MVIHAQLPFPEPLKYDLAEELQNLNEDAWVTTVKKPLCKAINVSRELQVLLVNCLMISYRRNCITPLLFKHTVIIGWSDAIMILHHFCAMYASPSWLCPVCWCGLWKSSTCQHFSANTSQRQVPVQTLNLAKEFKWIWSLLNLRQTMFCS